MRNNFADEITQLAASDKRIVLLSGDIGNKLFDGFKAKAPDRFFNCGVAEANMTGMAAETPIVCVFVWPSLLSPKKVENV